MKIPIVIFDGVDELDFVGPYEVFRQAAMRGKDIHTSLVTLESKEEVLCHHGLRVIPDGVLEGKADVIVVPGGGWVTHSKAGVRGEIERGALLKKIVELHKKGTVVAGVCTGAMALSAAGLLKGRKAITHRGALADLRKTDAKVVEARVVDDGDIVTCGGVTSGLDLALWLMERFFGADTADAIGAYLEYPRTGAIMAP